MQWQISRERGKIERLPRLYHSANFVAGGPAHIALRRHYIRQISPENVYKRARLDERITIVFGVRDEANELDAGLDHLRASRRRDDPAGSSERLNGIQHFIVELLETADHGHAQSH